MGINARDGVTNRTYLMIDCIRHHTTKASYFGPHGNFGHFLLVPQLLWMNDVSKMNKTKFVDLQFFDNFYSLHFPVGHVSMIASCSEKEVLSFHEFHWVQIVKGFDGSSR
jgi:hypothetical protein